MRLAVAFESVLNSSRLASAGDPSANPTTTALRSVAKEIWAEDGEVELEHQ